MTLDLAIAFKIMIFKKHKQQKKKIDNLDVIKIKNVCASEDVIKKEKIFTNHIFSKEFESRIDKEQLNNKKKSYK